MADKVYLNFFPWKDVPPKFKDSGVGVLQIIHFLIICVDGCPCMLELHDVIWDRTSMEIQPKRRDIKSLIYL